ncbi:unnamed protein product [Heterobilharzia americana]|nr:unnamed protein product [Heterobilharzia americana]
MNCRFRVVEEVWCDPNPDHDKTSNATASDPSGYDLNADHIAESKAPYTLIVSNALAFGKLLLLFVS